MHAHARTRARTHTHTRARTHTCCSSDAPEALLNSLPGDVTELATRYTCAHIYNCIPMARRRRRSNHFEPAFLLSRMFIVHLAQPHAPHSAACIHPPAAPAGQGLHGPLAQIDRQERHHRPARHPPSTAPPMPRHAQRPTAACTRGTMYDDDLPGADAQTQTTTTPNPRWPAACAANGQWPYSMQYTQQKQTRLNTLTVHV